VSLVEGLITGTKLSMTANHLPLSPFFPGSQVCRLLLSKLLPGSMVSYQIGAAEDLS